MHLPFYLFIAVLFGFNTILIVLCQCPGEVVFTGIILFVNKIKVVRFFRIESNQY